MYLFVSPPSLLPIFDSRVAGRTAHFVEAWSRLTRDPWVISTISTGFVLEFIDKVPSQFHIPLNASMDDVQFSLCADEVNALIKKGAVVATAEAGGFISRYFLVPKKGPNEWRPIINLKPLNQFIVYRHFKMEGVVTVRHTVKRGDFMAKVDLTDAYFTVPVFEGHRKFLRFRWGRITYEYTCLPFGLSSSPWVFTKLLRVVVSYLRRLGIRLVIYLDDLLVLGSSYDECASSVVIVIQSLESLGFLVNFKKSETDPTQCIEYIGLIIDSLSSSFRLTEKKISDIVRLCKEALKKGVCSLRALAQIIGNLNWATYAVPYAPAHFRGLQSLYNLGSKANNNNLDVAVVLDDDSRADLLWWISEADFTSGRPLIPSRPEIRIASDASLSGWGAVCQDVRTGGHWTQDDLSHINALELLAALKALQCFTVSTRDSAVEIEIDNTTAVSYINRLGGCKSKSLCRVSLLIVSWCEARNLSLNAVFVPGVRNTIADAESRRPLSSGDWMLSRRAFKSLSSLWPVQVDLFASDWNHQLPRFVSWMPQPQAWRIDAFSVNWRGLGGYCFPPFNLIPFCLSKLREEEADVVLVTPYWHSQHWFPMTMELSFDAPRLLLPHPGLLTSPLGSPHPLSRSRSFLLVAWMLSGNLSKGVAFRKVLSTSSSRPLAPIQDLLTSPLGTLGEIGVFRGIKIPCRLLPQS